MPPRPLHTFSVRLCLAETDEIFSLPRCRNDLTLKKLKSHLELLTGIPFHFQRLQYLDEADLPDESTFKDNDIVPGGRLTMRTWRHDGWGHLVAAAAEGDTDKLAHLGVTEDSAGTTPHAELLGPEQKKEWVAHRAFVALFIAVHRGHIETAKFLLINGGQCIQHISSDADLEMLKAADLGADLHAKTPLGRTALHVAAAMGRCDCIELLLSWGAKALVPDDEGQTAVSLARLWGQKQSQKILSRSPRPLPPSRPLARALQPTSAPTS